MKALRILAVATLVAGGALATAGPASAATATCGGTFESPGLLAGHYNGNVVVTGLCLVDGAPAVVNGNVTLAADSALNATFALDDVDGHGATGLTVFGNVRVGDGALLGLGCEPEHSPCSDDPAANEGGTLTGMVHIYGNVSAHGAAGVIAHAVWFGAGVTQSGGGTARSCAVPESGIFAGLQSPPFSDYEDNTVGGSLSVSGVMSCWFGALRNTVHGNMSVSGSLMDDRDANEVLTNRVWGNLACSGNDPVVEYGDSSGSPNRVSGNASGECSFTALQPDPAPDGPLTPISVHA